MWISEQTAIIFLCNINWLVFITQTECVYCAVRAEFLNKTSHFALKELTSGFSGSVLKLKHLKSTNHTSKLVRSAKYFTLPLSSQKLIP
jgi:hypothetical protein